MQESSSMYITTLPSLVPTGIAVVDIYIDFSLSRTVARQCDQGSSDFMGGTPLW